MQPTATARVELRSRPIMYVTPCDTPETATPASALWTRALRGSVHVLLLADVLYTSRLYRVGNLGLAQPLLLGACAALIGVYTVLALVRLHDGVAALVVSGGGLIVWQIHVFAQRFDVPMDLNTGFQFAWLLTFVVSFSVSRAGLRTYLADMLFRYASFYSLLYVALAAAAALSLIPGSWFDALSADDAERGTRIFCHLVAVTYAGFCWLRRAMRSRSLGSLLMLAACVTACALAQSRVITVLAACVVLASLFRLRPSTLRLASLAVLWAGLALNGYGLIDANWNPYRLFAGDSSGNFRMWEYDYARQVLLDSPGSGAGFATSQWHAWSLLNYSYFSASDLGPIGVWFDWGLPGLVLFIAASHIATAMPERLPNRYAVPLFQTGCLMAAYGVVAPVIFYPAGATYFAVLFGFWLDARRDARQASACVVPPLIPPWTPR